MGCPSGSLRLIPASGCTFESVDFNSILHSARALACDLTKQWPVDLHLHFEDIPDIDPIALS
eukprot:2397324-Karenia_brevis.AAC.1